MVQLRTRKDFEAGTEGAAVRVVGGIDEARNASVNDRAGAHGTGFEGNVKRGTSKTVVAEEARGFTEDNDFRVGGGVIVADSAIAGAGEDVVILHDYGADRNFAGFGRGACFGEGKLHEVEVVGHRRA